jgi:ATP phosphoribosyltransferase
VGDVHLGITGEDLLRDSVSELEKSIALVKPLGFGFADVVVAVPQAWIDVATWPISTMSAPRSSSAIAGACASQRNM